MDTLERTGDFSGAREGLIDLALLAQDRQQGDNEEADLHLPAWIMNRDLVLQQRIAGEKTTP